jgi:type IV secretion system protein VirD4
MPQRQITTDPKTGEQFSFQNQKGVFTGYHNINDARDNGEGIGVFDILTYSLGFVLIAAVIVKFIKFWLNNDTPREKLPKNFFWAEDLGLLTDNGIILGGARKVRDGEPKLLRYAGDRHLLTIAPNGSGKMTTVQSLVMLGQFDRSMVVIDPKGQLAAISAAYRIKMGHKVVVLNPFKLHTEAPWNLPCHSFNPLASLDPLSPSFVSDVARLSDALIELSGKDSHWSESARDLFGWLIMWTVLEETDKTLSRVRDLLSLPESEFTSLAKMAQNNPFAPLRNKAGGFVELTNETRSIISTAKTQTRMFDDPLIRENLKGGGEFQDFGQLRQQPTTVYLILPADYIASHNKWLRVMVVSALSAFYRNPKGNKVLLMLDEFAQLGYMDDIRKGAGLIRDYGVTLWPFFQDWNQVKGIYNDFAESLVANCGVVQCFDPGDDVTANWIIDKIGSFMTKRTSQSVTATKQGGSQSVSTSEIDDKYKLNDLHNFLAGRGQILFVGGRPCLNGRFDYYTNESWAALAKQNPYFSG